MVEGRPQDFRYHAAYLAYSKAWDENSSDEVKAKLNELLSSLKDDDVSYELFYKGLDQFRGERPEFQSRIRIKVQKKKEWRKSEEKSARNARHKK
ncbi:MAG: hypothetical protein QXI32_05945 [Candidatus Bathyarchaeia archaeon]